ncbi:uncharacterized protein LOC113344955 [Papaver somniferum]|uniref:uncharacterized protein LOC113344955 n=1 Tax=Papaver somniferum TaxID=3469 RepID=UPI000E701182|nr:uncharacterized protein LOC113344955 [Papaver somniferum]
MKIKANFDEIERLELKYDGILKEKSKLQDEINKLKKFVDVLNGDLVRERQLDSEMETIQKKLDLQVEESRDLKMKIKKLEKNEVFIQKKLSEVEMENEKLVKGKKSHESVKSEKKAAEKKLTETLKALDDLKQHKERIVLQKENIEKNRLYQLEKIDDLEKQVQELAAKIASLEKNRVSQFWKIEDLEKHVQGLVAIIASLEKNNKMLRNKVTEENNERDEAFQGLLGEKNLIEQKLVDLEKMFEELKREKEEIAAEKNKIEKNNIEKYRIGRNKADQSVKVALENVKWRKGYTEALEKQQLLEVELDSERKKVKEIVQEKVAIERTKMKMENEVEELRNELAALEMSISQLEKSYNDQTEANKHLESEVGSLNDNLKSVAAEKSEIHKELELKKNEELSLSLKVKELQNCMDEAMKEIEEQKKGTGLVSVEMKKLETQYEMLIQEKSLLEKKLVGVEMGNKSLTSKMMSAQLNAGKALLMLKDAAGIMGGGEDEEQEATVESVIDMKKIEGDILTVASELESIGNAFKNKDKKMEEMTQQIEKLNKSAKKNSNIWALVYTATTILAAAAATYIARGH